MRTRLLFLVFLIVAVISYTYRSELQNWYSLFKEEIQRSQLDNTRVHTVFVVEPNSWLRFSISPSIQSLTLLTNANVPVEYKPGLDEIWNYSIRYQLLNSSNEIIKDGEYFFRSKFTEYFDPETGNRSPGSFYFGENIQPLNAQSLRLNLSDFISPPQTVDEIRIQTGTLPDPLTDISLRLYVSAPPTDTNQRYQWRRLSSNAKQRLAQSNVYSYGLLNDNEKINILENLSEQIAPQGVEGADFRQRNLYVEREAGEAIEDREIPPIGFNLFHNQHGIIPLPEQIGTVFLEFIPIDNTPSIEYSSPIKILQYGRGVGKRRETSIVPDQLSAAIKSPWPAGMLEIIASYPMVISASYQTVNNEKFDITPENRYFTSYTLQPNKPISYEILSGPNSSQTPVRIDLRELYVWNDEVISNSAVDVVCRFLNSEGQEVAQTILPVSAPASYYDQLSQAKVFPSVSEKSSYYFALPPTVQHIEMNTQSGMALVSCYNRLPGLMSKTYVPESYIDYYVDEISQRYWFSFHPNNLEQLMRDQRRAPIRFQSRPPEAKKYIEEGEYKYESFQPINNWRGRQIILPMPADEIRRVESLPFVYQRIPQNQQVTCNFVSPIPNRQITPTLILFSNRKDTFNVEIYVDGHRVGQKQVNTSQDQIRLPNLTAGKHQIRVCSNSNIKIMLNSMNLFNDTVYMKRLTALLDQKPLEFIYPKASHNEEQISVRFFSASQTKERKQIQITIEDLNRSEIGPFPFWTLSKRLFDLAPSSGTPAHILNTNKKTNGEGQLIFLPLGEDLPPGEYRIRIKNLNEEPAYISVSRLLQGRKEQRTFFVERELAEFE